MLIGEGTSDIQKMIIGRALLKQYKKQLQILGRNRPHDVARADFLVLAAPLAQQRQ
jgi:hypothetical protein